MAPVDILLVAGLGWFAYKGYVNGLAHEVLSVVVVFASLWMALNYTGAFAPRVADIVPGPAYVSSGLAFLFLFGLTLSTGRYLNTLVRRMWQKAKVSPGNKLAGLSFGIFKGAVVMGCAVLALRFFTPEAQANEPEPDPIGQRALQLSARIDSAILAPRLADMLEGVFDRVIDKATGAEENADTPDARY